MNTTNTVGAEKCVICRGFFPLLPEFKRNVIVSVEERHVYQRERETDKCFYMSIEMHDGSVGVGTSPYTHYNTVRHTKQTRF